MTKSINRALGDQGYVQLYGVRGSGETFYNPCSNLLRSRKSMGARREERQPCKEFLEERHGDVDFENPVMLSLKNPKDRKDAICSVNLRGNPTNVYGEFEGDARMLSKKSNYERTSPQYTLPLASGKFAQCEGKTQLFLTISNRVFIHIFSRTCSIDAVPDESECGLLISSPTLKMVRVSKLSKARKQRLHKDTWSVWRQSSMCDAVGRLVSNRQAFHLISSHIYLYGERASMDLVYLVRYCIECQTACASFR